MFDVEQRTKIAASAPRKGIVTPLAFDQGGLVYRRWSQHAGDQELRLELDSD